MITFKEHISNINVGHLQPRMKRVYFSEDGHSFVQFAKTISLQQYQQMLLKKTISNANIYADCAEEIIVVDAHSNYVLRL